MEYKELKEIIKKASDSYYKDSEPFLTDLEYDSYMAELNDYEKKNNITDSESPTQKVGSDLTGKKALKHDRKMLSLEDFRTEEEVRAWFKKLAETLPNPRVIVDYKFDGNSASIHYKDGKIEKSLTRGDGEYGEDITENIRSTSDCNGDHKNFSLEVRGEILMEKAEFQRINTSVNGKYANARNLASGTLKLLDVSEYKKRKLSFFAYWLENSTNSLYSEDLEELKKFGFRVEKYYVCTTADEVISAIREVEKVKYDLPYEIDGCTMKLDQKDHWADFGETDKFPRWAKCFKYEQLSVETTLDNIEYWVGRTGKITPVGMLSPVNINGSLVSKASLSNESIMNKLGIRIGDTVKVRKACEIIPEIFEVVSHMPNSKKVVFPKTCPTCNSKLYQNPGQVDWFCSNDDCRSKFVGRVVNFMTTMEIDGFAEKTVEKLVSGGILSNLEDICTFKDKIQKIAVLERMSEKIVSKLSENIEASKNSEPWRLLAALGIRNIGNKASKNLLKKFRSIKVIMGIKDPNEFLEVEDIGDTLASALINFFGDAKNRKELKTFMDNGWKFEDEEENNHDAMTLAGKTIVITGALSQPRTYFENLIEICGGKLVGSVTKNTSYLFTNDKTTNTSKNIAARNLGVPIISEAEFFELCGMADLIKKLE